MVKKRIQNHCYLCAVLCLEGKQELNDFSQITSEKNIIITGQ